MARGNRPSTCLQEGSLITLRSLRGLMPRYPLVPALCATGVHCGDSGGSVVFSWGVKEIGLIGLKVRFGPGCTMIRPVRIGHRAYLGADSVVIGDLSDDATGVGMPARAVKIRGNGWAIPPLGPTLATPCRGREPGTANARPRRGGVTRRRGRRSRRD